ncbi:MAG: cell division protein FtsL [Lachnospiraceae bacterium]|nr:cell division protein FtsL [Lachnospiraceae bacterium]
MAKRQRRYASYSRSVEGNTVRKYNNDFDVVRELEREPKKQISKQTRRNREKAKFLSPGQVAFLFASICLVGVVLYGYLTLQSANTAAAAEVAALQSQLNTMKLDNEEEYSRIMSSVNMEEIKVRAIEQLGMQYAQEGQVIEVPCATDDYVRQYQSMP